MIFFVEKFVFLYYISMVPFRRDQKIFNKEEFMSDKKTIVPYFARFLEGNVKKEDLKNIKAGEVLTHKYPSDRDDVQYLVLEPLD
jgi:HSP90 family molecular chaperone